MLPALTKGARGHDVKVRERSGSDFFLPEMSPLPNLSLFLFGASFLWKMMGRGSGQKGERNLIGHLPPPSVGKSEEGTGRKTSGEESCNLCIS